ncbi:MAG: hypothetical protein Q8L98_04580 [Chlamydiales bacterium]|nr:hypothetical protein [Chlamydiales bacterium]
MTNKIHELNAEKPKKEAGERALGALLSMVQKFRGKASSAEEMKQTLSPMQEELQKKLGLPLSTMQTLNEQQLAAFIMTYFSRKERDLVRLLLKETALLKKKTSEPIKSSKIRKFNKKFV